MEKGDHVEIRGFGTFKVVERAPRTGRNPKAGATIAIPKRQDPDLQTLQRRKEQNRPALTMNLLLISVDSLRLDFAPGVSAAVRTPRFSDLTRDFHLCQHCFSVSSATRPVHTSLFTGLYPFEHGIEGQHSPAMRQGFADLFALCHRAGYAVGAFSEAPDIFTGLSYANHIAPLPAQTISSPAGYNAASRPFSLSTTGAFTPLMVPQTGWPLERWAGC